jgi:NADPH2:quinone reductase
MATQWLAVDFGGPEVLEQVQFDLAPPGAGEVTIHVRAAGMNAADYKHIAPPQDRSLLPLTIGYEVAEVISAVGEGAIVGSSTGKVADEVVAFKVIDGYSSDISVKASHVFAKPFNVIFAEAANLLFVGTTASEMLHVTGVHAGDVVLLQGQGLGS